MSRPCEKQKKKTKDQNLYDSHVRYGGVLSFVIRSTLGGGGGDGGSGNFLQGKMVAYHLTS